MLFRSPEFKALRAIAAPNIEFCGRVSDPELRELYARCRAFVMPGEEDFGMTVVEALASGKPVLALGRGGALETVPMHEPLGGLLYPASGDESLAQAIEHWDTCESRVQPAALQAYAGRFSEAVFRDSMTKVLGLRTEGEPISP